MRANVCAAAAAAFVMRPLCKSRGVVGRSAGPQWPTSSCYLSLSVAPVEILPPLLPPPPPPVLVRQLVHRVTTCAPRLRFRSKRLVANLPSLVSFPLRQIDLDPQLAEKWRRSSSVFRFGITSLLHHPRCSCNCR